MNEIYLEYGDMLKWDNGRWSFFTITTEGTELLLTLNNITHIETEIWSDINQCEGMTRIIRNDATIKFKGRTLTEVWRFADKPTLVWKRRELNEFEKAVIGRCNDWHEAVITAQKAIDKQIAKETIRLKTDVDQKIGGVTFKSGCTIHKCPECDNFLPRWAKYCPHCGQAIVFKQTTSEEETQTLKEVE